MPVFLRNLLVGLAFVPMLLVLFLFAAIRFTWLDPLTSHLPMAVRTTVSSVLITRAGFGKDEMSKIDRVLRLDPDNVKAWSRRCSAFDRDVNTKARIPDCRKAVALDPNPWNLRNLANGLESSGDLAGAEATMKIAQSKADTVDKSPATFLRELGRLEMVNGHPDRSLEHLSKAELFDSRDAASASDDNSDAKDDLETDREYLVVLYDRMHQPAKSAAMCKKAMPEAKTCGCDLDATHQLKCSGWKTSKDDADGNAKP